MPLGSPRHGIDLAIKRKMKVDSFENANEAYAYMSNNAPLYDKIGAIFFCMEDEHSLSLQSMTFSKDIMDKNNWYKCRQQFLHLGKQLTIDLPVEQMKMFLSDPEF
tara:strand:+ start:444 stop:761 length:318 start_codon:yes stop_codon:yes gene_type:complete